MTTLSNACLKGNTVTIQRLLFVSLIFPNPLLCHSRFLIYLPLLQLLPFITLIFIRIMSVTKHWSIFNVQLHCNWQQSTLCHWMLYRTKYNQNYVVVDNFATTFIRPLLINYRLPSILLKRIPVCNNNGTFRHCEKTRSLKIRKHRKTSLFGECIRFL